MSLPNENPEKDRYAEELVFHVRELLGPKIRELSIEVSEEGLILSGNCDTFHAKQSVQEAVSKSSSRPIAANLIVVREHPE